MIRMDRMDNVTLHDVYNKLGDVEIRIAQINERMIAHDASHVVDDRETRDHEQRLRAIERWKYAVPSSVILALGAVVAAFVT